MSHGSAAELAAAAGWTAEAGQAHAYLGTSVATAGGVNGNGYSGVSSGARGYNNGVDGEGGAFVYHGSASGLSATAAWAGESDQSGARFGNAVASAGDVNGDGHSDVVVDAHGFDNGQLNEGRAFVYLGSPTGLGVGPGRWILVVASCAGVESSYGRDSFARERDPAVSP